MAKRQKNPRERFLYLRELVTEFQDSSSVDAKEQVLANLANFAYNPDNYNHFRELNIVDLFLDQLDEENDNFVEFAVGGLCNIALGEVLFFEQKIYVSCSSVDHVAMDIMGSCYKIYTLFFSPEEDKNFKELIYKRGGITKVIKCLSSQREETVLSAITCLMYLVYPESKSAIINPSVIDCMLRFQKSNNRRLSNLSTVFLQDYCSFNEIQNAKQLASSCVDKTNEN